VDVVDLPLAGLKLLAPKVFADSRGFFLESWRTDQIWGALGAAFVQDNHSRSTKHTIRGLHFQRATARAPGQAKLVRCARGKIFDAVVDIRKDSPTFGKWHAEILDDESHKQLFIPVGFAHGFCVLSDVADVCYKTSSTYDAEAESGFQYDDPAVGVAWPIARTEAVLSARDANAKPLKELFSP